MIRVTIVEDDCKAADHLEECLKRYCDETGCEVSVARFSDAISFLEHYTPIYDIVFMDIELPDLDGMTAAGKLREKDRTVILIFVTNMAQYAVKGYEVGALDFIVKPVGYYSLAMKLEKAMMNIAQKEGEDAVIIPVEGGFERISAANVMYVEVMNHNLIYHTVTGNYRIRGSLNELEQRLKKMRFTRCNSCYLVNPKYIKGVKNYTVNVGGDELMISHPRKKDFMKELADYFGMK